MFANNSLEVIIAVHHSVRVLLPESYVVVIFDDTIGDNITNHTIETKIES